VLERNSHILLQDTEGKEEKGQEAIYLKKQQYGELSLRVRPDGMPPVSQASCLAPQLMAVSQQISPDQQAKRNSFRNS